MAAFDCNSSCESLVSSPTKPIYYRTNWEGVDLPRPPSLRLIDDAFFFELIGSYHPNDIGNNRKRHFNFVQKFVKLSRPNKNGVVSTKYTAVPIHVRKLEIELAQRNIPRYPSQTHLSEPSFYPLRSSQPLQLFSVNINSNTLNENNEDNTIKDEQTFFTSYYDGDDDGEIEEKLDDSDPDYITDQELDELQLLHSKNIELIDQKERNRRLEMERLLLQVQSPINDIDDDIGEEESSKTTHSDDSPLSSTIPSEEEAPEEEPIHEPKVGVVPPSILSQIIQARMELRCRKVPVEHKKKFENAVTQAAKIGQFTRLNEHVVEAFGEKSEKYEATKLPSATWEKGQETVSLPNLNDPASSQFSIFKEAVALGSIKALKPTITTNYARLSPHRNFEDDEIDVDDSSKPKYMRIKYLTELYVESEHRVESIDEDIAIKHGQIKSLDDVKLPTNQCPIRKPVTTKMTSIELREALATQVAEIVWDRRYRLERPRAQQRITYHCKCKYCKTSSPYQTVAYRKKWLVQQNLWKEPPPPKEEPIIAVKLKSISQNGSEVRYDRSVNIGNISDTIHSDTSSVFATEEVEWNKKKTSSPIFASDEDRVGSSRTSKDESRIQRVIPDCPKSKPRKTFKVKVQSLLGLKQHSTGGPTRRPQKEASRKERLQNARKKRLENAEIVRKKRLERTKKRQSKRGLLRNRTSVRSLFGKSSHHRKTANDKLL